MRKEGLVGEESGYRLWISGGFALKFRFCR